PAGLRRILADPRGVGIPRRHGPGPGLARRHRDRGGGVPAARGGPQAVPTAGRRPHLAGPPVGTPGRGGGYGLRGTTAWRRRRRRPCGGLGGGRHGGRGGTGTAARRDGRGRTRREGAGPYPSRRRAETRRLLRLLGSIPTWLAGQLSPPAAGAATA